MSGSIKFNRMFNSQKYVFIYPQRKAISYDYTLSVNILDYFWRFFATNFLSKVAQIPGDIWAFLKLLIFK